MWSNPSPSMLNSTQSIHKFFMCVLFETRSKSSLCPCQLKNFANETLKLSYLNFWFLPLKPFHIPWWIYLFTHDLARSPPLSTWWHMSREWEGSGARSSNFLGRAVSHLGYKCPSPFLTSFLLHSTSLPCSSSQTLEPPLLSSSPVMKSFTASTSSPSYSRRPRISSLRRRRSCLPQPS